MTFTTETQIEDDYYLIKLTKDWNTNISGKEAVSYWYYEVQGPEVKLIESDTSGDELISIIK